MLFGFKRGSRHKWMRLQKFCKSLTKGARSVSMNNPHLPLMRERGFIQKFVYALGRFLDTHANHVDFVRGERFARL